MVHPSNPESLPQENDPEARIAALEIAVRESQETIQSLRDQLATVEQHDNDVVRILQSMDCTLMYYGTQPLPKVLEVLRSSLPDSRFSLVEPLLWDLATAPIISLCKRTLREHLSSRYANTSKRCVPPHLIPFQS